MRITITYIYIDCVKDSFTHCDYAISWLLDSIPMCNVVGTSLAPILHTYRPTRRYTDLDSGIHVITVTVLHLKRQRHDFVCPSGDKDLINE